MADTTLTDETLTDDPLALLNAEPEDRRAFFEARLDDPADVQQAITLTETFEQVFRLLAADEPDPEATAETVEKLNDLWLQVKPPEEHIVVFVHGDIREITRTRDRGGEFPAVWWDMIVQPDHGGGQFLWQLLMDIMTGEQAARIADERETAQRLQKRSDEERLGVAVGFARAMQDGVMNWPWDMVETTVATSYPEEIAARAVEILQQE